MTMTHCRLCGSPLVMRQRTRNGKTHEVGHCERCPHWDTKNRGPSANPEEASRADRVLTLATAMECCLPWQREAYQRAIERVKSPRHP